MCSVRVVSVIWSSSIFAGKARSIPKSQVPKMCSIRILSVIWSSLAFAGKARSLPQSQAPEMCSIRVVSGRIQKHLTSLDRPSCDKHSSLFMLPNCALQLNFYDMHAWGKCYKTNFFVTYKRLKQAWVFVIWSFKFSLMFADKARGLPKSQAPELFFIRVLPNIRLGLVGLPLTNTLAYLTS